MGYLAGEENRRNYFPIHSTCLFSRADRYNWPLWHSTFPVIRKTLYHSFSQTSVFPVSINGWSKTASKCQSQPVWSFSGKTVHPKGFAYKLSTQPVHSVKWGRFMVTFVGDLSCRARRNLRATHQPMWLRSLYTKNCLGLTQLMKVSPKVTCYVWYLREYISTSHKCEHTNWGKPYNLRHMKSEVYEIALSKSVLVFIDASNNIIIILYLTVLLKNIYIYHIHT